ncbi:MAG TPA: A/G-specific adenine glycosylase [Candidatus Paceibacterota bacterium]
MKPSSADIETFKKTVWGYYDGYARDLPWRHTHDPYLIFVSEMMLQQTQVARVIPKYDAFTKRFPTADALAKAPVADVLTLWQGLGYNRRALQLKRACEEVIEKYGGAFPQDKETLISLPGIGQSTAGAIGAFSFNKPSVFIETNIRAVYLYHFFKEASSVSDTMILDLIEKTVDHERPREWYYALYDYGSMLKAKLGRKKTDVHKQSRHYAKQSKFEGSNRQIRSNILKTVLQLCAAGKGPVSLGKLKQANRILSAKTDSDIEKNLDALVREGFITETRDKNSKSWNTAQ